MAKKKQKPMTINEARAVILDNINYICADCAKVLGGTWPKGHCATQHTGICKLCKQEKGLCNVGDWNWTDKVARGMRD
jgi:hypothetical protein